MNAKHLESTPIDEESQFIIDQLYQSTPTTMIMPDGQSIEVPDAGNIGLLAYGYKGIIAWRKQREKIYGARIYSPYIDSLKKEKEEKEGKIDE